MTSENVQDAISELFTSVSNGKTLVAAITDKGVATAATDSFIQMAANIGNIQSGIRISNESFSREYTVPNALGAKPNWEIQLSRSGYTLWENCFVQITSYAVRLKQSNYKSQTTAGNYELGRFAMALDGDILSIPVLDWWSDQFLRGYYAATGCTVYYIDPA